MAKTPKAPLNADTLLLAKRIRQFRESLGLSRPKFADILDVPPTTLKNYELGYRTTGSEFLIEIGKKYGASVVLWMMGLPSTFTVPAKDSSEGEREVFRRKYMAQAA